MSTVDGPGLLRVAAQKLRDTAAKATPGPWVDDGYDDNPGDQGWWIMNGAVGMKEYAVACTFALNRHGEADAAWIALASPVLAAPLAAWLEQVADADDEFRDTGRGRLPKHHALAVARAVLGGTE